MMFLRLRDCTFFSISAGLIVLFLAARYAMRPETCGVAMEVPDMTAVDYKRSSLSAILTYVVNLRTFGPLVPQLMTLSPGAKMSRQVP